MIGCSVLMPVYNSERYICKAIESVLDQEYKDFELVIIDDGSTDKSAALIQVYADADPRIRFSSRENRGVSVTRNELVSKARAELVAWLDSDDIAYRDRLKIQIREMKLNPDLVAIGSQARYIDCDGRPIGMHRLPCDHDSIDEIHMSGSGHAMAQPSVILRKEMLERVGGFSPDHVAEDIDIWLRLAEHGRLANTSEILLDYRLHASSYGHRNRSQQAESGWLAAVAAAKRRGVSSPTNQQEPPKRYTPRSHLYEKWGWWALQGNYVSSARHYALRAIASNPWRLSSWKLLACALRGH